MPRAEPGRVFLIAYWQVGREKPRRPQRTQRDEAEVTKESNEEEMTKKSYEEFVAVARGTSARAFLFVISL